MELSGKKRKCIRCGFVAPVEWFELGLNKRKNKQGICPGCQADDNQERRRRRLRRKALELPEHAYCDRHMAELLKNSSN